MFATLITSEHGGFFDMAISDNFSSKTDLSLAKLCTKLEVVDLKIDEIKEKQEEMNESISKVKEALYGPDEGLYARLRDLETWKKNMSRVIYVLVTSWFGMFGYVAKTFLETITK